MNQVMSDTEILDGLEERGVDAIFLLDGNIIQVSNRRKSVRVAVEWWLLHQKEIENEEAARVAQS